jgi:hypothetical protein
LETVTLKIPKGSDLSLGPAHPNNQAENATAPLREDLRVRIGKLLWIPFRKNSSVMRTSGHSGGFRIVVILSTNFPRRITRSIDTDTDPLFSVPHLRKSAKICGSYFPLVRAYAFLIATQAEFCGNLRIKLRTGLKAPWTGETNETSQQPYYPQRLSPADRTGGLGPDL